MALNDVLFQNYRSILDSDDDELWSLGSKRSSSSNSSDSSETGLSYGLSEPRDASDFSLFQDYFGLSNLLNNVKISEDNPLLYSTQKNLLLQRRARRSSWSSDASDSAAVLSPTIEGSQYDNGFDNGFPMPGADPSTLKQLPPPSMRLSKAMRDHIISGAYQQQISNSTSEKLMVSPPVTQARPSLPPSPPRPQPTQAPLLPNLPATVHQPQQPAGLQVCVFCRNNGESESVYTSHVLKDADGRTSCPILRAYTCPICKANGDNSHTIKYCPMNQNSRNSVMGAPPANLAMLANQRNQQQPQQAQVPRIPAFRPPFPNLPPPPQLTHPRMPPLGKMR